jgi:GNAT superfamily N-acetyltransferase
MRLVACYSGGRLDEKIVEFINEAIVLRPDSRFVRPFERWRLSLWFGSSSFQRGQFSLVLTEDSVAGYSWAWVSQGGTSSISLSVDPRLPEDERSKAVRGLLALAKRYFTKSAGTPLVVLRAGGLRDRTFQMIAREVPFYKVLAGSYLMVLENPKEVMPPQGYEFELVKGGVSYELIKGIVETFNDAFSIYDDYSSWSVDDAFNYYSRLLSGREAFLIVALKDGKVVGFIESFLHRNPFGEPLGYHSLLAVRRDHQGRGIGSFLLMRADSTLREMGARITYLHAEPKASDLYLKLGFKIVEMYMNVQTLVSLLPGEVDGVVVEDTC